MNNTNTQTQLKRIFSLAWPTMLEQVMQTAVQYIDTAMVGVLGTAATAAVGSTSTVNWLVGSSVAALGIGFLAYISQAMGAGRKEHAKRAAGQAALAVLVAGGLFTLITVSLSGFVPRWMQVDESVQALASRYFLILYLAMLPRSASIIFGSVLRAACCGRHQNADAGEHFYESVQRGGQLLPHL